MECDPVDATVDETDGANTTTTTPAEIDNQWVDVCDAESITWKTGDDRDRPTTACPRNSDPFYMVTYYIEWVATSWTYCIYLILVRINIFETWF